MKWKELKNEIESKGVSDETEIVSIDLLLESQYVIDVVSVKGGVLINYF